MSEVENDPRSTLPTSGAEVGSDFGIGARLEQAREALGMRQEDMASKLGVSLSTYHRHRRDGRALAAYTLLPLAKEGINLDWLVTGEGSMMRGQAPATPQPDSADQRVAPGPEINIHMLAGLLAAVEEMGKDLDIFRKAELAARQYAEVASMTRRELEAEMRTRGVPPPLGYKT